MPEIPNLDSTVYPFPTDPLQPTTCGCRLAQPSTLNIL